MQIHPRISLDCDYIKRRGDVNMKWEEQRVYED